MSIYNIKIDNLLLHKIVFVQLKLNEKFLISSDNSLISTVHWLTVMLSCKLIIQQQILVIYYCCNKNEAAAAAIL